MKRILTVISRIEKEEDLQTALHRISELLNKERTEDEETELDFLDFLVLDYEKKQYPIGTPDAIELIKEEMQDRNWQLKDLAKLIGHKSATSEILNRKRPLSLKIMKIIHDEFKISYETLMQASEIGRDIKKGKVA